MIHELIFKRATKKRQYCILNEDIDSGAYRDAFHDAFLHYKDSDEYEVEEYPAGGLIVKLPRDCLDFLPADIPVLELNTAQSKIKLKEVFAKCKETAM